MSLWPRTRRNERSASSMPAAIQRFFMEPSFHLVTRPVVRLAIEIIDSMQFVVVSVPANVPPTPSRRTVNMSSSPSRSEAAASGWSASSSLARLLAAASPLAASGWAKMRASRLSVTSARSLGRYPSMFRLLCKTHLWTWAASPNTFLMPAARALAPSMTQSTPESVQSPRATRSLNRAVTTVLFSVSPSQSPTGTLVPSEVITRHTTTHEPATSSPSIMRTATSRSDRFRAINSPMALAVAVTKRRETAELDIDFERASSSSPTGSATSPWRRVATPASMRSTTSELSRSAELNAFQVSSSISPPVVVRPLGRSVLTRRPPSTTEPLVVPCQLPVRSSAPILACFGPMTSANSACIIWCITTNPVADAKANNPSLIAPATSARAIVAPSGRSANRAASSASATPTTATFFFTVVPLLFGCLGGRPIPTIWQVSGGGPPPYFNNVRDNVRSTATCAETSTALAITNGQSTPPWSGSPDKRHHARQRLSSHPSNGTSQAHGHFMNTPISPTGPSVWRQLLRVSQMSG